MSPDWQPSASLNALKARAELLADIRHFFLQAGVMEVETPLAASSPGTDPALDPMVTDYSGPGLSSPGIALYLQTSPEFAMKRLLAAGLGDIYQISKAFRNGEAGRLHNPEFSLLEWYRLGFDHHALMNEVAELVSSVLSMQEPVIESLTYRELFLRDLSLDPLAASNNELEDVLLQHGIELGTATVLSHDELLDLIMSHVLEPGLDKSGMTFIYDFPASKASLARLDQQNPSYAHRFELYVEGIELANGFYELTDASEQRSRFEKENQSRLASGQMAMPLDERLLSALEAGLPDCSGVALGIDRLLMLKLGATHIKEVLAFPLDRC